MRIKDLVENIGKKRLIIIASIFIALLILIAIVIACNANNKQPTKTSAKVTGSSLVDESSDNDSSKEDSSSTADSKTDTSSVLDKDNPTTTVTTKTPAVKPIAPENVSIKFEVVGFQSANTTPKYSFPVPLFERIFGKTKNINGSMGKYLQQGDTVNIKISSGSGTPKIEPIGNVSVLSFQNGIATIKILDTAKKNVYNNVERLPIEKQKQPETYYTLKNEDYIYKVDSNISHGIKVGNSCFMFGVFDKIDWISNERDRNIYIIQLYRNEINLGLIDYRNDNLNITFGYTNGDVNKSFMKCIQGPSKNMRADDIISNDSNLFINIFSTIDFYKSKGYRIFITSQLPKTGASNSYDITHIGFVAK